MSVVQIENRIEKLQSKLVDLQAELAVATAAETLEIGATYAIKQGKGDTATVVDAVLVAQKQEEGKIIYRFMYGEGFDAKFATGSARMIVWPEADDEADVGARPASKVAAIIDRINGDIVALQDKLALELARTSLAVGETYSIKVGRGENRRLVPGLLLGEGVKLVERVIGEGETVVREVKQFKFLIGEGFDTELIVGGANLVEFAPAEDAPEAETTAAE